ncbi:MAG TPA: hypothetical protein V6D17_07620 [Candidatus Obscuribacterales bacterium]
MSIDQDKPCRHEYVRIYQRKLKGLERRLTVTRAFLPIGFKMGDFGHLGEGSYCFCSKCRVRLYPRRTQQEKLLAKAALAQGKAVQDRQEEHIADTVEDELTSISEESPEEVAEETTIHVDELELEAVDMEDIEAEGVKLGDEKESCGLTEDEGN